MNSHDFRRSVVRALQWLVETGVALDPRIWDVLKVPEEFKSAAMDAESSYTDVYLIGLSSKAYNVVLFDYSYFQFFHEEHSESCAIRLAFYPTPFMRSPSFEEVAKTRGSDDMEEFLSELADAPVLNQTPMIRYEYAPRDYVEYSHPASHFHLGLRSDGRWYSNRVLDAETFVRLVCRNFYFDYLWRYSLTPGLLCDFDAELIECGSKCKVVASALYSNTERKLPAITC